MHDEPQEDRRFASSDDIRRLVDSHRATSDTMAAVVKTIGDLDKRVLVLEVKHSLSTKEVEEIKDTSAKTLQVLAEHTKQEDRDRQRLLLAVVSTLLAVLGGVAMLIGQRFVGG